MVRNAIDHGIESPEIRATAGKPLRGQLRLSAYHQGGNISIEISDDGRGLDRDALYRKAIERGMIEPRAQLTDAEIFGLVFAPGLTTAARVTDISGRGVGMDVVRRNIEALRGRVEIRSDAGVGSTFTICLPLTLAIIDGMIVQVGAERFILQTLAIEQSLRPSPEQITTVQHRGEVLNHHGQLIPLMQLGEFFGLTGRMDPCTAMVVIARCEDRPVGLVVDDLIGQQQVVIKTLGERFERLPGISGAAILGDGRVGLIMELTGLVAAYQQFTGSGPPSVADADRGPDRALGSGGVVLGAVRPGQE
jgi:two-component system chemotaxis sensor kinase CheA